MREWQTVTVASPPGPCWISRFAIGLPTMLLTADDDRVGALGLDARADQHLLHAVRACTGAKRGRVADDQLADVHRVEAVHVLRAGRCGAAPSRCSMCFGSGQLHQDAVDRRVGVEPVDDARAARPREVVGGQA